jgi:hypothetical protein
MALLSGAPPNQIRFSHKNILESAIKDHEAMGFKKSAENACLKISSKSHKERKQMLRIDIVCI